MTVSFVTYRKFNDTGLANELAVLLAKSDIQYMLEDNSRLFNPNFANNTIDSDISIKLRPADFAKADEALAAFFKKQVDQVDSDYYLLSFTNEELTELVAKPDEWGPFDYQLALKLLKERGQEVTPEAASLLKEERINTLAQPEPLRTFSIVSGYLCAVLLPLFGIFIGAAIVFLKKTLPDGRRVYVYHEYTRNNGRIIMGVSILYLSFIYLMKGAGAVFKMVPGYHF